MMHSLRMCCEILCQNLLVHPKCTLGGSTKFHAFHVPPSFPPTLPPSHIPSHPPPPTKWKFQFRTGLRKFEVDFWKLVFMTSPPHPHKMEISVDWTGFRKLEVDFWKLVSTSSHPLQNGNFSSGLDLENLKLTFGN